jgi:cobalt-zinc-cadmium efflux system outer membrane protein
MPVQLPTAGPGAQAVAASAANAAALSWDEVRARFEASNPALKADALNVDELKAEEITASLRPNPTVSWTEDQLYPFGKHTDPNNGESYDRPFSNALSTGSIGYLWERDNKRNLRHESAMEGTRIGASQHQDLVRNMLFNLRVAFVGTLEAKQVLELAKADLDYYDKIIGMSHERLKAGDIAEIDFDRIELARVEYEQEIETATVNLRTAKIQLLQMLNDRMPVDQFDVRGDFSFSDTLPSLGDVQQQALAARPDLQAALETLAQSKTNYKLAAANGSTDPTIALDGGANPPLDPYVGINIQIPLRIFDRNQGEKQRTKIDINRSQALEAAAEAQVFRDVDSAYEQLRSTVSLLDPYRDKYNGEAKKVRDTVTYSYLHGGAALMDFLNAQSEYRQVQLAYAQLVGTYMTAAGQLNLAVGREVIP